MVWNTNHINNNCNINEKRNNIFNMGDIFMPSEMARQGETTIPLELLAKFMSNADTCQW